MTSSNGAIFRVTGPLCGEFTGPGEFPARRPVTRSFNVFFDLCLNKRLTKQPWSWWFETPPWSLWRQCNVDCFGTFTVNIYSRLIFITFYLMNWGHCANDVTLFVLWFHLQNFKSCFISQNFNHDNSIFKISVRCADKTYHYIENKESRYHMEVNPWPRQNICITIAISTSLGILCLCISMTELNSPPYVFLLIISTVWLSTKLNIWSSNKNDEIKKYLNIAVSMF